MLFLARIRHLTLGALGGLAVLLAVSALPGAARPVAAAVTCDVASLTVDAEEQAFLGLINNYRAATNAGPPMAIAATLNRASSWMSGDMAAKNYLSHTDSLGRDPFTRMDQCDVAVSQGKAENVAAGYETAAAVFEGWKNSPGHNANMLNVGYRSIGISRVYNAAALYGWYWTTNFSAELIAAAQPNICGGATVSSNPNATSMALGTAMTFTASVTGCSTPSYWWWAFDGTNWLPQGTWTASNTFTWTPTTATPFYVAYWVKQQGTTPAAGYDAVVQAGPIAVTTNTCINPSITIQPNLTTVKVNTKLTFTASVAGCASPLYQWWFFDGANWLPQAPFSAVNNYPWTPATPGTYYVAYWAKNSGTNPANGQYDLVHYSAALTVTP